MANTEIFNQSAKRYDTEERIQIANLISNIIREYIVNGNEKRAIDFGCGTGLVGLNLINDFKSILFLDSSQNMLECIEAKIQHLNVDNVDTLCFDFETDYKKDLSADYIFMSQVLLHIRDIESILKKLYTVLNDDGHILIIDFNKNELVQSDLVHNGFDIDELTLILKKIGFKNMTSKTFFTGEKVFMNEDASLFILDAKK